MEINNKRGTMVVDTGKHSKKWNQNLQKDFDKVL